MRYRKKIYVTVVTMRNTYRMYATTTLKKIADKLRLMYDYALNIDAIDDSENAPATIYQGRKGIYTVEINKVICV